MGVPDLSDVMRKGISVWIIPRMLSYWFKLLFLGSTHAHSLFKCFLLIVLDDTNGLTSLISTLRNASQALTNFYSSSLLETGESKCQDLPHLLFLWLYRAE